MKPLTLSLFVLFTFIHCQPAKAQHYVFYLHGRIVEEQGVNAVSPEHGQYLYKAIIDSLGKEGIKVMSEVREKNTDALQYAQKISNQVDSLLVKGIKPGNITIIGASKGGYIAMYVSSILKNRELNFVLLGCCPDAEAQTSIPITFYGNILSIYEESDVMNQSCEHTRKVSSGISHYKEVVLHTGLKHGFLYRPLPEWLGPALQWIKGNYN